MELRHIRYFIAVAEELNFGRAAARLHMAQPPLSAQIQALEKELGVRLFDRTGRGTTLTREGEVFLLEARQICDQVSRARRAVHQTAAGDLGRLRVAGVPYAFMRELPMVIPRFRRANPNILLDLRESGIKRMESITVHGDMTPITWATAKATSSPDRIMRGPKRDNGMPSIQGPTT